MRFDIGDHLAESGAARMLRRLNVDIFLHRGEACTVAYSFKSFNCAGIEKPSFSCSFEETRA